MQEPPTFRGTHFSLSFTCLLDVLHSVLERNLIECRRIFRHVHAEIYNPCLGRAAGDIHAIGPRPQYVAIRPAVWIQWGLQPLPRQGAGDIESTNLDGPLK